MVLSADICALETRWKGETKLSHPWHCGHLALLELTNSSIWSYSQKEALVIQMKPHAVYHEDSPRGTGGT